MKLIILDRDGVINHDRDDFVKSPDEWQAIEGSMDAIAFLTQAGYTLAVATNQSGIGRQFFYRANAQRNAQQNAQIGATSRWRNQWHLVLPPFGRTQMRLPQTPIGHDCGYFRAISSQCRKHMVGGRQFARFASHCQCGRQTRVGTHRQRRKTLAKERDKLPENTLIFDSLLAFSQFLIQEDEEC